MEFLNDKERLKRIGKMAAVCLLLLIPMIVAVISYTAAQKRPVTENSVSELVLSSPDGNKYTLRHNDKEEGKKNAFASFFKMNESGSRVTMLPSPEGEYSVFEAKYVSYNKVSTYKYYISTEPENAFYSDHKGNFYKISKEAVSSFLSSEYAMCVYPSASQPTLSVGDKSSVLPQRMKWKFLGYNDKFHDGLVNTNKDGADMCTVSGGLQLSFDNEPDYIFVVLSDADGNTVFEDSYDKLDTSYFADNTVYNVRVTAKWYEVEGRSNFGEGVYSFTANVLSPAVFYVNKTDIEYGDFVIVSAKNIVDKSLIKFNSEPSIDFEPVFIEKDGYYHALVPVSLDCIEKNEEANRYLFTLSYGDAIQELALNVTKRTPSKGYPDISIDVVTSCYNNTTRTEFKNVTAPHLASISNELYWMSDNMLIPPTTRNVRMGFGFDVIVASANVRFTHEGVDFKVKKNDTVSACLPGKVIWTGETALSGKTVIVDHGGGLKSLYANMSSIGVDVGDVVEKGKMLGIVGSTGFCGSTSLHFGLYVFDVPVRYYSCEEEGIHIAEPLRNVMNDR